MTRARVPDPEPMFSVVMSARNAAGTVARSLHSFLDPHRSDLEIIVIDDASSDGTQAVLSGLAGADSIKIIRLPERVGLTKALNIGIREARGRFIVRQDADDYSHPERLDAQFRRFCRNGKLDILGTGHTILLENGEALRIPGRNFRDIGKRLAKGPVFCHGSLMMKRASLAAIGGYDAFFEFGQDTDLILRADRAGLALENLPECLYDWTDSPRSVTSTRFHEQAAYESLALRRMREPGLDLESGFAAILGEMRRFPLSKRFRDMTLFLAAGHTGKARRFFAEMEADGEPIPDRARYAFLVRLPGPAYRLMRGLRDRWS